MSENVVAGFEREVGANAGVPGSKSALPRFRRAFSRPPVPFELQLPDGGVEKFGQGQAKFRFHLKNAKAVRAFNSIDEGRIADAYLEGDFDIEGDLLSPFKLRPSLSDLHLLTKLWRFLEPVLFGQVRTNRRAIASHYEIDPEFFLSFLDPNTPCYTQGVYHSDNESLTVATLRKFEYCFERLRLKPGDHLLEIGPGWGAWFEFAASRGVKCTGISISQASIDYLNERAKKLGYDWELIYSDLLEYETTRKYDAIVIMGVIEHLPQYDQVLRKFVSMLKPGRDIFLDGSACTKKYDLGSFNVKHIYPANHSFLVLHDLLAEVAKTPLRPVEIFNDQYSYYLTFQQWARNLDANREFVVKRFGEFNYRRFRLYLWSAAHEFLIRGLECYRMILHYPESEGSVETSAR
jgi:cyclopropane-fatty-acyl-phospholipid synthase